MRLAQQSLTPAKSIVETTVRGRSIGQRIKFINKKGTFKETKQYKECTFTGKVQDGLGYFISPTCDRDEITWRKCTGTSDRECKFFKQKD